MEEILASIRRIIADDEALPIRRNEKENFQSGQPSRRFESIGQREAAQALPKWEQARAQEDLVQAEKNAVDGPLESGEEDDVQESPIEASCGGEIDEAYEADGTEALDDELSEIGDDDAVEAVPVLPEEASGAAYEHPPLVSPNAAASIASHFQALAAGMVISEAHLIERYAQDLLRPMLKQWLDDNLPALVERLVRAEIERVARGRR